MLALDRIRFKRWMTWIRLGDGFLDTCIGPVDPDLYFAAPPIALCMAFLGIHFILRVGTGCTFSGWWSCGGSWPTAWLDWCPLSTFWGVILGLGAHWSSFWGVCAQYPSWSNADIRPEASMLAGAGCKAAALHC